MVGSPEQRRVLLVADDFASPGLRELFLVSPARQLEHVHADSLPAPVSSCRHQPCEILLVDESVYRREGPDAFAWLARRRGEASLVVADRERGGGGRPAYSHSVTVWLPRELVLRDPQLLVVALHRAARFSALQHERRRLDESLQKSPPADRPTRPPAVADAAAGRRPALVQPKAHARTTAG